MLLEGKLTDSQKLIIRHICSIQLESLQRLYNNEAQIQGQESNDLLTILKINEVDEEKFEDELMLKIYDFEKLHEDPNKLTQMPEDHLSVITHILVNIQEKYEGKYPNALRNIWKKLFFIREVKLNFNNN